MPSYECEIVIVLPTRATEALRDDIEEALLDGIEEVIGDVGEAYFDAGRHRLELSIRDLKSGVIAIRRVLNTVKGVPAGVLLEMTDEEGEKRTLPLEGSDL